MLRRILVRHQEAGGSVSYDKIREDFLQAYPGSTRVRDAIRHKCVDLLRQSVHGFGGSTPSIASAEPQRAPRTADSVSCPSATPQATGSPSTLASDEGAANALEESTATSLQEGAATATLLGDDVTMPQPSASAPADPPREDTEPVLQNQGAPASDEDVDVFHEVNGIRVVCPPGFEVRVYSPSHVKVRRQGPLAFERSEPAFHLQMLDDASIHPVRLPPSTRARVVTGPPSGAEGAECAASREIRWTGPDGYWVSLTSG